MITYPMQEQYNPRKSWGRIHVYTGEGKGKTTAALGLGVRAVGHGFYVLVVQFLKNHKTFGESQMQHALHPYFKVVQFGQNGSIDVFNPSAVDMYYAQQGLQYARDALLVSEAKPDLLILDEVNPLMHYGFINEREILDFLDNKPQNLEVVLTGRYAPSAILDKADLVTEMSPIKHYYTEDFQARQGIEH